MKTAADASAEAPILQGAACNHQATGACDTNRTGTLRVSPRPPYHGVQVGCTSHDCSLAFTEIFSPAHSTAPFGSAEPFDHHSCRERAPVWSNRLLAHRRGPSPRKPLPIGWDLDRINVAAISARPFANYRRLIRVLDTHCFCDIDGSHNSGRSRARRRVFDDDWRRLTGYKRLRTRRAKCRWGGQSQ